MQELYVIAAPSGTGKTVLVNELLKKHQSLARVVTCTTRPKREGEVDGISYYFLTKEEFLQQIAEGKFIEHAEVFGQLYGVSTHGIAAATAKGKAVLVVDIQGVRNLKPLQLGETTIFLMPPSLEELENRLRSRNTDSDEVIRKRLSEAPKEMAEAEHFDHVIVNDNIDDCLAALESVLGV